MPRHNMIIGGKRTPGGLEGTCSGEANSLIAGVRSPPLRGVASALQMALRGISGDDATGGFLGGTHSVRPHGKAGLKPRHNIIIGSKGTPGALAGTCLGQARAFLPGMRSPPLRGEAIQAGMVLRRKPWHNAEGGFLGGTHSVRPHSDARRKPRHNMIIGGK